ncbi:ATP-binding cassette domain-containing protein [Ferrimicrobium sp.]|uniref:ABC transporter ATP-binding protein n=1 Tax=Ferrimicrobium sp. TaxID=2926050 RepID=UPI0026065541|nr:ATP-binding cassette domain-containing protein [Ferrimicrobium sp.]
MAQKIIFENVSYQYPAWGGEPAYALDRVSAELGYGITAVIGDSGSGKSTLLRLINGLIPHFHGGDFSGRVTVEGKEVVTTPTRELAKLVGFVFQEPENGFVRGTVAREVAFGPENLGFDRHKISAQVVASLQSVGILHLIDRRIRTLSGGERQRVAVAAALATDPATLVLDEPMSQLDENGARLLGQTLTAIAHSGTRVVLAEHRLAGYLQPDHIIGMHSGHLIEENSMKVVVPPPCLPPSTSTKLVWELHDAELSVGTTPLLTGINLAGREGEVTVITGANGGGKTTLLRAIGGLSPLTSGSRLAPDVGVAYLPQEPGVLLHRTRVIDEVAQTLKWLGLTSSPMDVLEILDLAHLAQRDPRDLSGGERQRAALAVVLAGQPRLALLDEPTRGMDEQARMSLVATLTHLAEHGTATIVATHDRVLAHQLAPRVWKISGGTLIPEEGVGP